MPNIQPVPVQPRVLALLVTHDGARWLPEVLTALQTQQRPPDRIVAVDTGSIDRTREILVANGIETILADRDSGFGEAINWALVEILGWSGVGASDTKDWLWLLHDDFAPAKEALSHLLEAVASDPSVAIAGPKLRGWHDRNHLLEVGISIAGNGARWTGLERRERDQGQHDGAPEVLSVSSAGMLVRADVWHELGGFDPQLSLFRDDVDFGWRAHVAGHRAICVSKAIGLHAEAAATERRAIDVDGAVFHRPHLLDRRNANYVLLANCSRIQLIPVLLRLTMSTALRTLGYLFAKLPGYAADETGALVLVLTRLDLIRAARKSRKKTRLLPAKSVNRFLAPNRELIRSSFDSLRALIIRGAAPLSAPSTSFSDARLSASSDDEDDVLSDEGRSVVRKVLARPVVAMSIGLIFLALIAGRNRLGALSGGALLPAPNGASDLFSRYLDSWHSVSLGSAVASPPWMPLLVLLSSLVGGRVPLMLTLLFLLAIPASAAAMYALMRRVTTETWLKVGASILYALSPSVVSGIVDGHLSIAVNSWLLPLLLLTALPLFGPEIASRRRFWSVGLLLSIAIAFAPIVAVLLVFAYLSIVFLAYRRSGRSQLMKMSLQFSPLLLAPLALLFPWSLSALAHPTLWLHDPGIQITKGSPLSLIFLSPDGLSTPPYWLGAGLLSVLVLIIFSTSSSSSQIRNLLIVALSVLGLSIPLSLIHIAGPGTSQSATPWLGSLTLVITLVLLLAAVFTATGFTGQLAAKGFGREHAGTAFMAVLLLFSILGMALWLVGPGSASANRAGRSSVIPAFIAAAGNNSQHFRTLVLSGPADKNRYTVIRDRSLQLGDAEVTGSMSSKLRATVATLIAGGSQTTSVELGQFAIQYVMLIAPLDQSLVRSLDGVSGLSRISSTPSGILWKVAGVTSRIRFVDLDGISSALPSSRVGAQLTVAVPGRIVIADRGDPGWRAFEKGVQLTRSYAYGWATSFGVTKPGKVLIVHDSTKRRAGVSVQLLAWLGILVFILPGGRRKIDRSDEEVA